MSQPFLSVSAAGLKAAGVTLSAAEAVACVVLAGDFLEWSSDAPDPSGVILRSDGRIDVPVRPAGAHARVETYARLLHRLLPEAASIAPAGVPGALRLAVARGLGVLDAPPFGSPKEFRKAIERFLTHRPEDLIIAVLVRWAEAMGSVPDERPPERRVSGPRVDVLRRMLREADLERYALLREHASGASAVEALPEIGSRERRAPEPVVRRSAAPPVEDDFRFREVPAVPAPLFATQEKNRATRRVFAASAVGLVALLIWVGFATQRSPDGARVVSDQEAAPFSERAESSSTSPADVSPPAGRAAPAEPPSRPIADEPDAPHPAPTPAATSGTSSNGDVASAPAPTPVARPAPLDPTRSDAGDASTSGAQPSDVSAGPGFQLANVVDGTHRAENVSLSPDGSRVAFDSDRDGVRGVYIAARDGTGVRRVGGAALTVGPAWSPDNRTLAVLRAEDDMPQVRNLWLLDLDSGQERRLTQYRYGEIFPASWFPDGRRLCYAQGDRLYVTDTGSGASRSYDSPVTASPIRAVAASPDGRHIVFHVQNDGVWLMNLHDGSVRRVLEDPTVERLAWSPSGRSVAYYSGKASHWGVWVMAPRKE